MSLRWIGIFTLGGLVAILVDILRRRVFVPLDPERLLDTRPDPTPPSEPDQAPGPDDPESTEPLLTPERAPGAHRVVPS
jgi:hypothetical protein